MNIDKRIAIVTGAGSGIGRAAALALLRDGWYVSLAGRRAEPLHEVAGAWAASGHALAVPMDVTDPEAMRHLFDATVEAVRLRLRPILMTSLAFGFGVIPLAIGTGAGAGGRNAIGTAVLGGMVASTVLGIFMVPVFFLLIRSWFRSHSRHDEAPAQPSPAQETAP